MRVRRGFGRLSLRRPASRGCDAPLDTRPRRWTPGRRPLRRDFNRPASTGFGRLRQAQPAPAGIAWGVMRPTARVHAGGRPAAGPSDAISTARLRQASAGFDRLRQASAGFDRLRQASTGFDRLRQASTGECLFIALSSFLFPLPSFLFPLPSSLFPLPSSLSPLSSLLSPLSSLLFPLSSLLFSYFLFPISYFLFPISSPLFPLSSFLSDHNKKAPAPRQALSCL